MKVKNDHCHKFHLLPLFKYKSFHIYIMSKRHICMYICAGVHIDRRIYTKYNVPLYLSCTEQQQVVLVLHTRSLFTVHKLDCLIKTALNNPRTLLDELDKVERHLDHGMSLSDWLARESMSLSARKTVKVYSISENILQTS